MVTLQVVEASNESIKSALPAGLVAVFVGGTNGVGETTVKQFAKHTIQPRVYIVGRSEEAGKRIVAECEAIDPKGTFVFMQHDTSLMRNVDHVCAELAGREKSINVLFLTVGTLQYGTSKLETKRHCWAY